MDPYNSTDYDDRKIDAARRAIVDVMQVLASYKDSIVLIGGWVPDLLINSPTEPHIGSIDVDLALKVDRFREGKYAELLKLLLQTGRYRKGLHSFQLIIDIDLNDGEPPVEIEIDFLAEQDIKLDKNRPPLIGGFRILQADGCRNAFEQPENISFTGKMANGSDNTVEISVASISNFLIMKCFALTGRDKPKDAYDICYCLDYVDGGARHITAEWKAKMPHGDIDKAIEILSSKFNSSTSYGPQQVVEFHSSTDEEERQQQANRAFFLVTRLLELLGEM